MNDCFWVSLSLPLPLPLPPQVVLGKWMPSWAISVAAFGKWVEKAYFFLANKVFFQGGGPAPE